MMKDIEFSMFVKPGDVRLEPGSVVEIDTGEEGSFLCTVLGYGDSTIQVRCMINDGS